MEKFKYYYKNTSDLDQALIGFGLWKAGETRGTHFQVNNPNFELVDEGVDKSTKQKDKK